MKIRITGPNIYGPEGMYPVGAEFDVEEIPVGWASRCVVVDEEEPVDEKLTKDELIVRARELGIAANRQWGVKKIAESIAEAEAALVELDEDE